MTRRTPSRAAAVLLLTAALTGCDSPFKSVESDYGMVVPADRLRAIQARTLDEFKAPPADTRTPATEIDKINERFANLESLDLTLEQARANVLENNLDLRVALIEPTIANQRLSEAEARFEAAFTTRALYRQIDSPSASTLSDQQATFQSLEPGVRIPLRSGGTATVGLPISRSENNNPFTTLNPAWTTDLAFSISQPLLRDAGRRTNTHGIRIASLNRQISESQTKLEAIRQLAAVDRAYWRLYQVRGELDVRQQQFELADAQLKRAERLLQAGRAAEIEVIRAQAGVADRLEAILVSQNTVLIRQRELKRVLNIPGLDVGTRTLIVPETPPDPVEYQINSDYLANEAVANRMEMLELELRLAADQSQIDFNRNQALPLFTVDYGYNINGLGESSNESLRVMRENNFEDWQFGLNLEIPMGNEAARSRVQASILQRLQRLSTREARRIAIRQEVYNAVDQIDAGWQRIFAARQSVILNTRALQAEQRQFDVGTSTSTNVLDAASRLAESQLAELRAIADYQIAQVDLSFATGTLLGAARVRWEPLDPRQEEERIREQLPKEEPVYVPAPDPAPEAPPAPSNP